MTPTPDRYSAVSRLGDGSLVLPLDGSLRLVVHPDTGLVTLQDTSLAARVSTVTTIDPRNLSVIVKASERWGGRGRGHRNLPHGIAGAPTEEV